MDAQGQSRRLPVAECRELGYRGTERDRPQPLPECKVVVVRLLPARVGLDGFGRLHKPDDRTKTLVGTPSIGQIPATIGRDKRLLAKGECKHAVRAVAPNGLRE